MYFVFLLLFLTISAEDITEDNAPNCYLEDLTEFKWTYGYVNKEPIEDVHKGIVKSFSAENITAIEEVNGKYFDIILENNRLVIVTNEKFVEFEKDIPTTHNKPTVKMEAKLVCQRGSRYFMFTQPVIDTNNHIPAFSEEEYIIKYAMSVPKNLFVTDFYEIVARDDDVSYNSLSFNFEENDYLKVVGRVGDGKKYYPDIKTTKPIELPFRKTFTLTATDSGSPSSSSTTNVTLILIKPEDVVSKPAFTRPVFVTKYNRKENTLKIMDEISLVEENPGYQVIQKDFQDFIKLELEGRKIKIDLIKQFSHDIKSKSYVILNFEIRHDFAFQRGKASILINFV